MGKRGQTESAADRRVNALELRKAGATFGAIAVALKISKTQAYEDIQQSLRELNELEKTTAEDLRRLELERLDMATLAITSEVRKGNLLAIDRMLRIMERRAKLLGLDVREQLSAPVPDEFQLVSDLIDAGILQSTALDKTATAIANFKAALREAIVSGVQP